MVRKKESNKNRVPESNNEEKDSSGCNTLSGYGSKIHCGHIFKRHHKGETFYCVGFFGVAVYFLSSAVGFWSGVLAILKALVWPAFVVYGLLRFLGI